MTTHKCSQSHVTTYPTANNQQYLRCRCPQASWQRYERGVLPPLIMNVVSYECRDMHLQIRRRDTTLGTTQVSAVPLTLPSKKQVIFTIKQHDLLPGSPVYLPLSRRQNHSNSDPRSNNLAYDRINFYRTTSTPVIWG